MNGMCGLRERRESRITPKPEYVKEWNAKNQEKEDWKSARFGGSSEKNKAWVRVHEFGMPTGHPRFFQIHSRRIQSGKVADTLLGIAKKMKVAVFLSWGKKKSLKN